MNRTIANSALSVPFTGRDRDLDYNERITELTKFIFEPIGNFTLLEDPANADAMLLAVEVDGLPYALDISRYEQLIAQLREDLDAYPPALTLYDLIDQVSDHDHLLQQILADVQSAQAAIAALEQDNTKNKSDIASLQGESNKHASQLSSLEQDNTKNKSDIASLKTESLAHGNNITTAKADIASLRSDLTTLRFDFDTLELPDPDLSPLEARLAALESKIDNNPSQNALSIVPLGMVYTQYPNTQEPRELWPGSTWEQLNFSGAFFRAEGGLAGPFASAVRQIESVPAIGAEFSAYTYLGNNPSGSIYVKSASANSYAEPASGSISNYRTFTFNASRSSGSYGARNEVAPANYTVRIWRCTKSNA